MTSSNKNDPHKGLVTIPITKEVIEFCSYLKYYAAMSNTILLAEWYKVHKVFSAPGRCLLKISQTIIEAFR